MKWLFCFYCPGDCWYQLYVSGVAGGVCGFSSAPGTTPWNDCFVSIVQVIVDISCTSPESLAGCAGSVVLQEQLHEMTVLFLLSRWLLISAVRLRSRWRCVRVQGCSRNCWTRPTRMTFWFSWTVWSCWRTWLCASTASRTSTSRASSGGWRTCWVTPRATPWPTSSCQVQSQHSLPEICQVVLINLEFCFTSPFSPHFS